MEETSKTANPLRSLEREYLRKTQVMDLCGGISGTALNTWIRTKDFPRPIVISQTFKIWRRAEVIAWIEGHAEKDAPEGPSGVPLYAVARNTSQLGQSA